MHCSKTSKMTRSPKKIQIYSIGSFPLKLLKAVAIALIDFLATPSTPTIRAIETREGTIWKVYDPVTDRNRTFYSKGEVYSWLEQRHYRR
jgi:hypothetical protein